MILKLTKRREPLGSLAPDQEQLLCDPTLDPGALADLLLALYREEVWLQCDCGWTMHIRGGHILARNPGQLEPDGEPCALCEAWPYRRGTSEPRGGDGEVDEPGLSLLATGRRRRRSGPQPPRERVGGGGPSMKYRGLFRAIWTVMRDGGFLRLGGPLTTNMLWQRVREALSLPPLYEDDPDGLTYADLAWAPDSERTPEEILSRIAVGWRRRGVQPQVWLLAIVEGIPDGQGGRLRLDLQGMHHTVEVDLPSRNRSVIGKKGPHMVLVQATRGADGGIHYDKLAAQAILSADCPVPVDSSHERDAIRLVQALGLSHHKPVFPYVESLKPDLMLLDVKVVVEVMGMNKAGYDEHKEEIMEQMRAHPAFRGWRVHPYRPNRGETPAQLRAYLRRWWRTTAT